VPNQLRTVLRRAVAALTIALLLIVALATGVFFLGRGLEKQVRNEEESIIALQALRAEVVTAQSSVRGYQLVRTERFLGPYRVALPAARRTITDLRSSIEPDEQGTVDRIDALFREWRQRFAEPTIAFVRQGRTEDAEALAQTGSGKRRIDRIKLMLARAGAEEQDDIEAPAGSVAGRWQSPASRRFA
jgi:CHASE3 domain sensor protein